MAKGNKKSDFQNLPACAAEFIKLVIRKMRYRKKVRRDVQAELAAHFEDELKACTSDKEKEQKAQQLIAGFGDVKLLAVLLRRAKKRCRPLWQTAVVRTFQTVGMLIICIVIYVVWFLTGKPVVTTNYVAELNRIVRPVADENLNAAPFYHEAAKLVEKLSDDMKGLLRKKYDEVTAEEKQLIEKWLNGNKEILELVIAGTQKPYYWQKYSNKENTSEVISILLPPLAEFRRLAYSLRWRIWLNAEQGRYQDAFDDIKSCYRLGQHLRGDKTLIEQLVGIAIEAVAVQTLRDVLDGHQLDSATLAKLQRDFEQIITDEDFTVSLKTEKLCMYDEIQRCFTEDRLGGGHLYLKRLASFIVADDPLESIFGKKGWAAPLHILFTHPNKRETRETADRYYAFWEKIIHKTPGQIRAEGIDVEKETMKIIKGNIFVEILLPALARVNQIAYRSKADIEATLTIIAILRYRQDTGDYPTDLARLVEAGYLKQLPIDPYSDKSLIYKRTDDGFMLYGIGRNFKDDGGQFGKDRKGRVKLWAKDGDWVFWPVAKSQLKQ